MNYDREIIRVLAEAGDKGLSMKKITMHVYNRVNGLFCTVDIEEVRRIVANYITRSTRQSGSLIERTCERGVYRLNLACCATNQLQFDFKDFIEENNEEKPSVEDASLSLFDY